VSKTNENAFDVSSRSSAAVSLRRSGYPVPGSVALLGTDFSTLSEIDKKALLREILNEKIHGISFSP
jgi:hypothetical protein